MEARGDMLIFFPPAFPLSEGRWRCAGCVMGRGSPACREVEGSPWQRIWGPEEIGGGEEGPFSSGATDWLSGQEWWNAWDGRTGGEDQGASWISFGQMPVFAVIEKKACCERCPSLAVVYSKGRARECLMRSIIWLIGDFAGKTRACSPMISSMMRSSNCCRCLKWAAISSKPR